MRRFPLSMFLIAVVGAAPVSAIAATVTFQDSTFTNTSLGFLYASDAGNSTLSQGPCTTCGNPGAGFQLIANFNSNAVGNPANGPTDTLPQATFGIVENSFTYNPSTQGAITSINASVDKSFTTSEPGAGIGNTFRPLIEQDGNFYLAAVPGSTITGPADTGYLNFSAAGLTAADFTLFNITTGAFGVGNPNFDGDLITFGFAQNTNLAAGTNNETDYDNLDITVNPPVPEPSTWAMLLIGFAGIGFAAHRRRVSAMQLSRAQRC
jgi:hypothetical protein